MLSAILWMVVGAVIAVTFSSQITPLVNKLKDMFAAGMAKFKKDTSGPGDPPVEGE